MPNNISPRDALQTLHNFCELNPCTGRERDVLRQSAETLQALILASEAQQQQPPTMPTWTPPNNR